MVLNNLSHLWNLAYATSCWTTARQPGLLIEMQPMDVCGISVTLSEKL